MGLILLAFSTLGAAPAQAQTVATDATLSEIVVNKKEGNDRGDEIVLEPAFSSDRTSYSFVVGINSSSFLTVRTTHPRATVRIFEGRLSHLETPPHLEGEVRHYAELMVQSLGGGRWSIDFNPSEGRYWIDVTVTSADEEHQVNYRLDYLARGRPPSLLWALIAPHGSRGTLDRVTLKYDKILRPDGPDPDNPLAPPASAFSVEVEGERVPVTRTQINAEYLQLRLARELSPQEQQVTVSYTRPATNPVQTNIGGLAFDFTDYPVDVSRAPTTNNSELSVADAEVTEGDGTMDFVVTLAPAKRPPAWVDYATADGTARAGEDYRATSGRVKFRKMETTKTVSVPIINDAVRGGRGDVHARPERPRRRADRRRGGDRHDPRRRRRRGAAAAAAAEHRHGAVLRNDDRGVRLQQHLGRI